MKVVSINDIVEVNRELAEKGLACKVHLRDACGKQTMWLELPKDGEPREPTKQAAQTAVRELFAERGYELKFDSVEGINFWVK